MIHTIKKISILTFLILILSGCTIVQSPKDLMKRPKSYVYNEEIQHIISKFLTDKKTLTLALGQKDQEAIRKVDLDGDGNEELLLLYKKEENIYGIMLLKEKNNIWHEINHIEGFGNEIDLVTYKDITGDQKPELFIGWTQGEKSDHSLSIYSSHEGYFDLIKTAFYIDFSIYDLDNDNKNEFILLKSLSETGEKSLEVFKYLNKELVSIDQSIIHNENYDAIMTLGNASEKQKGIFIDCYVGYDAGYTDLFIFKNNHLIEVLGNERGKGYKTFQQHLVGVEDINHDNIIEFGILEQVKRIEDPSIYDTYWLHTWHQWDKKDGLILVEKEYHNEDVGYKIKIPKQWGDQFSIIENLDDPYAENRVDFYILDKENKFDGVVFSIRSFSTAQWEEYIQNKDKHTYVILEKNNSTIIAGILLNENKKPQYHLSKETLKEIFQKLQKKNT